MHETDPTWSHEDMTLRIMDHALSTTRVDDVLDACDVSFVRLMVLGHDPDDAWPEEDTMRPPSRRFLCDVVHNRISGAKLNL